MNNPVLARPEMDFDVPSGQQAEEVSEAAAAPGQAPQVPEYAVEADVAADAPIPPVPDDPMPIPVQPMEPIPAPADAMPVAPEPAPVATSSAMIAPDGDAIAGSKARPIPRINIQAFCEDQRTSQILQEASQDRRLAKAHVSVQMGGISAAHAFYQNAPTPNLIIVESMHKRDPMIADLMRLAEVCDAGTKVIVIGHVNDVLLYRELLKHGIGEYLVMPLGVSQVMESISMLYTDPTAQPLGQVIAFMGAKGGVGSSTVCHNVAWTISEVVQSDVVITDFDLAFGTAGLDFNQDPIQGLADALAAPERMDEVLLDRLLSRCSDHLSLFAAPATLDQAYDPTPVACDTIIDVLRKNVPFVAADLPHQWTGWARQVALQADHIVITATPDLANLRNAKNLMEKLVAARPNDTAPHLLINQVGVAKRPEISAKDFSTALECDIDFVIDFDAPLFGTAANNGQMIEEVSAKAKAAEQFRQLANLLTDRVEAKVERKSLLAPILSRFSKKK